MPKSPCKKYKKKIVVCFVCCCCCRIFECICTKYVKLREKLGLSVCLSHCGAMPRGSSCFVPSRDHQQKQAALSEWECMRPYSLTVCLSPSLSLCFPVYLSVCPSACPSLCLPQLVGYPKQMPFNFDGKRLVVLPLGMERERERERESVAT